MDDIHNAAEALPNLNRIAYRKIEELIVTLQLAPVAVLSETALARRLGISRTPVREALLRSTRAFNICRMPVAAVPCGFSTDGLPLSLQLGGPAFQDARVLRAAHAYQGVTGWHSRRPSL